MEEFNAFLVSLTQDSMLMEPDCPALRNLIQHSFQIYNDQVKLMQSQKNTQQNISPSAYEMLKEDYAKLQKDH